MTDNSEPKEEVQITLNSSQIEAGRDVSVTGIQQETLIENVGASAVITVGNGNILSPADNDSLALAALLAEWQANVESEIEALTDLLTEDKEDLKEIIAKIKTEVEKAEKANPGRLERLLNSLAVMGSDIFEVVITTLASPLHGIGLVLKKIGDRARVERQAQDE